jgi:hypothetical protein
MNKLNPTLSGIGQYLTLSDLPDLRTKVREAGFGGRPAIADVTKEAEELRAFLGPTDYNRQLQQAEDAAKLQAALSIASRGFAAAGAAPKRGESTFSTLGRELLAPIGADLLPVATNFQKRKAAIDAARQDEDRKVRLAAYTQAEARRKEVDAAALKLLDDRNARILAARKAAGTASLGSTNLKLIKPDGSDFTYDDGRVPMFNRLTKAGAVGDGTIGKVGDLIELGGEGNPFPNETIKKENLRVVQVKEPSKTGIVDARTRLANKNLFYTLMPRVQNQQLEGEFTPYSRKSALYFDTGRYMKGAFPFLYLPPGTSPIEASTKGVPIEDETLQNNINQRVDALSSVIKADLGDQSDVVKTQRAENAIKKLLELTPQELFGSKSVSNIGKSPITGEIVGYEPPDLAADAASANRQIASALDQLKSSPEADPSVAFSTVNQPESNESYRKNAYRIKTAVSLFPNAFSKPIRPGTTAYDAGIVQLRKDIEAVLPQVRLLVNTTPEDRRQIISEAVSKKVEARTKKQNKKGMDELREFLNQRIAFRQDLLNFRNAARRTSGAEGPITGRILLASRLGFSDFIKTEEGARALALLTQTSDRFLSGQSRKLGKEFGDDRISNYDAEAYKKLVADIRNSATFNKALIDTALRRVNGEISGLMRMGGDVAWTPDELTRAAEVGVDFSQMSTTENWHGYGFYGKEKFPTTRQDVLSLSDDQRNVMRKAGLLKDAMYDGRYEVPQLNYTDPNNPNPTIPTDVQTTRMGPRQFDQYIRNLVNAPAARNANITENEIRRRVTNGILQYDKLFLNN